MLVASEIGQEGGRVFCTQEGRMLLAVEEDVAFDPVDVSRFCASGVVALAHQMTGLFK